MSDDRNPTVSDRLLAELARRQTKAMRKEATLAKVSRRKPVPPRKPVGGTYRAAVGDLRDLPWLRSLEHKDRVRFTDMSEASEVEKVFVRKLLRRAAKIGIPLECQSARHGEVSICHSRRGEALDAMEWEIIGHLGMELSRQYSLGVRWLGPESPELWVSAG